MKKALRHAAWLAIGIVAISIAAMGCQPSPYAPPRTPSVHTRPRTLGPLLDVLVGSGSPGSKFEAALEIGRIGSIERDEEILTLVKGNKLNDHSYIVTCLRGPQTEQAKDLLIQIFKKEDSPLCREIAVIFKQSGDKNRLHEIQQLTKTKGVTARESVEAVLNSRPTK
jgi:hypothetical protein